MRFHVLEIHFSNVSGLKVPTNEHWSNNPSPQPAPWSVAKQYRLAISQDLLFHLPDLYSFFRFPSDALVGWQDWLFPFSDVSAMAVIRAELPVSG